MRLFFSLYTSVSEHCQCFIFTAILDLPICILTKLPSASMQLKDFTVLLLSLHCGTWDMYPVAVPLNTHASIVQTIV